MSKNASKSVFKTSYFYFLNLLLISLFAGRISLAAGVDIEDSFPQNTVATDAYLTLQGKTKNGKWLLYTAQYGTIDNIEIPYTGTPLLVSDTGETRLIDFNEDRQKIVYSSSENKIVPDSNTVYWYTTATPQERETGAKFTLHLYDAEADEKQSYTIPVELTGNSFSPDTAIARTDKLLFVRQGQLGIFDLTEKTWQVTVPEGMFTCGGGHRASVKLLSVTSDSKVLFYKACSYNSKSIRQLDISTNIATKVTDFETWANLIEVNAFSDAVAWKKDSKVTVFNVKEMQKRSYDFIDGHFQTENVETVSPDGRFLIAWFNPAVITPDLPRELNRRFNSARVLYDTAEQQQAILTLAPDKGTEDNTTKGFELHSFVQGSNELQVNYVDSQASRKRLITGTGSVSLDVVFSPESIQAIAPIEYTVTSAPSVTFSLGYDGKIKLIRTKSGADTSQEFWLGANEFNDYRYGLDTGTWQYQFIPCDKNLRCDSTLAQTLSLNIEGPEAPEFSLTADAEYTTEQIHITFDKPLEAEVSELYIATKKTDNPVYFEIPAGETALSSNIPSGAKALSLLSRGCLENVKYESSFDGIGFNNLIEPRSCGQFTSPVHQIIPTSLVFKARVKGDLSGYKLYWERNSAYQYNLYQVDRDTSELSLVAENIQQDNFEVPVDSGQVHEFVLEACDSQTCIRKSSELILFRNVDARSVLQATEREISYASRIYYDQYRLLRRTSYGNDDYVQLMQTSNIFGRFTDNSAPPGQDYDYQLVGCINDDCDIIKSLYGHYISPSPPAGSDYYYPAMPEDFSVSKQFMSLLFEWQNSSDYDGIVIEELVGIDWHLRSVVEGTEQTSVSLEYYYSTLNTTWRIRSYNGYPPRISNRDEAHYSVAAELEVTAFDPFTATADYNEPFTIVTSGTNKMSLELQLLTGFDEYHLYEKRAQNEDFYPVKSINRVNGTFREKRDFREEFASSFYYGESAQYFIRACSSYTDTCHDTQIYNFTATKDNRDVDPTLITDAPTVSFTSFHLDISVNALQNVQFNRFNLYVNREQIDTSYYPHFFIGQSEFVPGETYEFATQHCVDYNDCSELSAPTLFTLPEQYPLTPPDNLNFKGYSYQYNGDETANVELRFDDLSNLNHTYEIIESIKIWALNDAYTLEEIAELSVSTINQRYTIENLDVSRHYSFYMQSCNANGCTEIEPMVNFYLPSQQLVAPEFNIVELRPESNTIIFEMSQDRYFGWRKYAFSNAPFTALDGIRSYYLDEDRYGANRFAVSGVAGERLYVATRRCHSGRCGEYSEHLEVIIPSIDTLNTQLSFKAESFFIGETSPLVLSAPEPLNMGRRNPVYQGNFTSKQQIYFGQGFELEMEVLYQAGCGGFASQYLDMPTANGQPLHHYLFRLGSVSPGDCYLLPDDLPDDVTLPALIIESPYLETPEIVQVEDEVSWLTFKLQVNEAGILSFYINNQLVSVSSSPIDLDFYQFAHSETSISSNSALSSFTITSTITELAPELENLVNRTIVEPTKFHPDYALYETFQISQANGFKLWNDHSNLLYESEFSNEQEFIQSLEEARTNLELRDYSHHLFLRFCRNGICPGAQRLELYNTEFAEITNWQTPSFYQNSQDPLINIRFLVAKWKVLRATHFNLLLSTDNGDSFETIKTYQTDEIWIGDDYQYYYDSFAIPENTAVRLYLEVCNPINCYTSEGSDEFFQPGNPDTDGDGVLNEDDAFPDDPNEWSDTDGDGIGDNSDPDIDNDGVPNHLDQDSENTTALEDSDNDGLSDALELVLGLDPDIANGLTEDSDTDGYSDIYEALAGSDRTASDSTPESLGYFESFENDSVALIDRIFDFTHVGSTHGIYGALKPSYDVYASTYLLDLNVHMRTGYVLFTYHSTNQGSVHEVSVSHNGRTIEYTNQEQYQLMLDENTTLFFIRIAHDYDSVAELDISINNEAEGTIDSLFVPGGASCRLKGQNALAPDFNCDGKAELVVKRLNDSGWIIKDTVSNTNVSRAGDFDLNVLHGFGDFNGDGSADIVARKPDAFSWQTHKTYFPNAYEEFTLGKNAGDIPVLGDYDGDGYTDIAVRRPATSMWYILRSSDKSLARIKFGLQATDIPVPGDYDGDGKTDIAVRRESNSHWYILNSSDGEIQRIVFGKQPGDIPVPADYDGDGITDIAVRRPGRFEWKIRRSSDGVTQTIVFGRRVNDLPVVADYDGDGKADVAVRRAEDYKWHILQSSDNKIKSYTFAREDDFIPLAAPLMLRLQMEAGDFSFVRNN